MNKSAFLQLVGAVALVGAFGVANAATVPAPIYDNDHTFFDRGGANIKLAPDTGGLYRFTVSAVTSTVPMVLAPDELGWFVREDGMLTELGGGATPGSIKLNLTAAQTYFINVLGQANPASFIGSGIFNLEVVQVIPIPAAAVLFSSALVGLVVVARRRNKPAEVVTA